jgi:gluconolactonase
MPRSGNPIDGFTLSRDRFATIGTELRRPECILAERDGSLWVADARGVTHIEPAGDQRLIEQKYAAETPADREGASWRKANSVPNGLAFDRDGNLLIANMGNRSLELMSRLGDTRVVLDSVCGERLGKVNFVCRDRSGRLWITVSTRAELSSAILNPEQDDGYVVLYDGDEVRVVHEGVAFANECRLDAEEEYLYLAQTAARNIVRLKVLPNGDLGKPEVFGPRDHGRFVDGITFDSYGNIWGTYVFTDAIYVITPDGELRMIFDDSDAAEVARVDTAFRSNMLTLEVITGTGGPIATHCASLTFGGPDLRTIYVGSLRQSTIPYFRAPVTGLPPVHWAEVPTSPPRTTST